MCRCAAYLLLVLPNGGSSNPHVLNMLKFLQTSGHDAFNAADETMTADHYFTMWKSGTNKPYLRKLFQECVPLAN